jgi:phenylalanyl-tRNA synthetase alpha chain
LGGKKLKIPISIKNVEKEIENISNLNDLQLLKSKYLGKSGKITSLFKEMRNLSNEEKREFGKSLNVLKNNVEELIDREKNRIEEENRNMKNRNFRDDETLPGYYTQMGSMHLITQTMEEIKNIWMNMGFEVVTGNEIEETYYNFDALNTPESHPARDEHDTFYIDEKNLLRTHTSPIQARVMEKRTPPLAIFSPGKCYRKDTPDPTHLPVFHQFEVLYVDKFVTVANLKACLSTFIKKILGEDRRIRLRPSFFPFTEPSFEVDVSCGICGGKGCRSCGNSGWLEILGSGMVHPNVFKSAGYDPNVWTGFAVGTGIERIVMLKYKLDDLRDLVRNDERFLQTFRRINL